MQDYQNHMIVTRYDQIWNSPNLLLQKQCCCLTPNKVSYWYSKKRQPICIKPKVIMVDVKVRNCQCNCPRKLGLTMQFRFFFVNSIYLQGFQDTLFSLEHLVSHFFFLEDQPASHFLILRLSNFCITENCVFPHFSPLLVGAHQRWLPRWTRAIHMDLNQGARIQGLSEQSANGWKESWNPG